VNAALGVLGGVVVVVLVVVVLLLLSAGVRGVVVGNGRESSLRGDGLDDGEDGTSPPPPPPPRGGTTEEEEEVKDVVALTVPSTTVRGRRVTTPEFPALFVGSQEE